MSNSLLFSKILAIVLLFFLGIQSLNAQGKPYETINVDGKSYYRYKVQPGEGLYSVSRTFSVTVADILRSNPGANQGLQNGQELLIPITQENSQTEASAPTVYQSPQVDQNQNFKHTVVKGETVFSISQMYNTTVEDIYRLNPDTRESISIGQVLTIPQRRVISEVKEENYRYHTILPKETLYSVSKTYSLKPEDVMAANPGLSAETFQIGRTIRIPFFESYQVVKPYELQTTDLTHRVSRGETLYSISRKYNVPVGEIEAKNPMLAGGLKTNMELIIPVSSSSLEGTTQRLENDVNRLLIQRQGPQRVDIIKVGLLLPFLDESGGANYRLQEYYEGFLMAVEDLKNKGTDLELYVFEIGKGNDTKKLESLLQTLEMQSLNLIIGGVSDAQIRTISDFSKAHNIKYVVPFSHSNGEVLNNGNIFQVNPLPKSLNDNVSEIFLQTYRNSNIIFVSGGQNDKMELLSQIQNNLRRNNIRYETISITSTLDTAILSLLSLEKENVIIPTSGDSNTLKRVIDELKKVQESNSDYVLRLFGYPEWQTYSSLINDYHHFGTHIYSPFFVDNSSPASKAFKDRFHKWYGRNLLDTNPGYGMWGYDTAMFFLTALDSYGVNFEEQIDRVRINSLQFPFNFQRLNNWGGFINSGMYFIYYDTNGRIVKMDKSR
ncbi:MAG: LysM peptidoglycan-binding domain-containing protein [Fermentimonas sp.]|nr:LysM peptidoglycan-binding domain-containing protein [Fermentimonas sp.]NLC86976.1 LysM peptidoglycan-binding domain-containing protein [Bacteroidales bacterium]MDD2931916.1 LysM peptidoglycan-binding domain-containing protein [Fermentimonas sp.]MDD3189646.1 LysM peptidoglycan-binding domain-containing protein [Fermentimonas sp.]MDD4285240.1 LysM peptidoglycan-binding domain-containing protein [Fermentimonas sp.]